MNQTGLLLRLLVLLGLLMMIILNMVIYQSIIQLEKQHKRLGIMLKIWLWKCLQQHWVYQMILLLLGIKEKNNGSFQEKFTKLRILHNPQKEIKTVYGQLW